MNAEADGDFVVVEAGSQGGQFEPDIPVGGVPQCPIQAAAGLPCVFAEHRRGCRDKILHQQPFQHTHGGYRSIWPEGAAPDAQPPTCLIDHRARREMQGSARGGIDPTTGGGGAARQPHVIHAEPAQVIRLRGLHAKIRLGMPGLEIGPFEQAQPQPAGKLRRNIQGGSGRAAVDHQHLNGVAGLGCERLQRGTYPLLASIGGHDDAEPRSGHLSSSMKPSSSVPKSICMPIASVVTAGMVMRIMRLGTKAPNDAWPHSTTA